MTTQVDLFSDTFTTVHPIQFARKVSPSDEPFQPTVLAVAPPSVVAMPEGTLDEKIAKTLAVLEWAMARYEICFSYSGGKDSSTVLSLALAAATNLQAAGVPVKRFLVLNSDTLVENPSVLAVVKAELARIRAWIAKHNLPGFVQVTAPSVLDQWAVSIIGGQTLLSTPMTNRNCTTDLKTVPLTRARAQFFGPNDVAQGRFTVGVTGVRFSESAERASNMNKRAESSTQVVQTNAKQDVFLAPIAQWDTDDVMEFIGLAVNDLLPVTIYSNFVDVWRIYKDAEGECTVGRGDKPSKGCSARHGCYVCSMVTADKSMSSFLANPQYSYMQPLAKFREYVNNTLFDMDKRYWLGRSIVNGHVEYGPSVYAPAYVQDLLRFALTIDRQEQVAAARKGVAPRFRIISEAAVVTIDSVWSLHAYAHPFTALKIYHDVYVKGLMFEVPTVPKAPNRPMPAARYIPVEAWDEDAPDSYTGLRHPLLELAEGPCAVNRAIQSKGQQIAVMATTAASMFEVNEESLAALWDFELERLVARHDACQAAPYEVFWGAGESYKFYLQFGAINLARSYVSTVDTLLRRSSWRARNGLAGFNFDHDKAFALSVEVPAGRPVPSAQAVREQAQANALASRQAARQAVRGRRLSLSELSRDWSPAVPWRALLRAGLKCARLPAHCLQGGAAYHSQRGKGWAVHHFVRHGALVDFLKDNPAVAAQVQAHRLIKRRKVSQRSLFAA